MGLARQCQDREWPQVKACFSLGRVTGGTRSAQLPSAWSRKPLNLAQPGRARSQDVQERLESRCAARLTGRGQGGQTRGQAWWKGFEPLSKDGLAGHLYGGCPRPLLDQRSPPGADRGGLGSHHSPCLSLGPHLTWSHPCSAWLCSPPYPHPTKAGRPSSWPQRGGEGPWSSSPYAVKALAPAPTSQEPHPSAWPGSGILPWSSRLWESGVGVCQGSGPPSLGWTSLREGVGAGQSCPPSAPINSPTSSSQGSLLAWRAVRLLRAPSWLARTGSRGPSRCFLTLPSSRLAAGILCEPTAASTLTRHCRRTQGGTAVWSPTQPAPSTGMWSWSSTVSPGPRGDGGGAGDRTASRKARGGDAGSNAFA